MAGKHAETGNLRAVRGIVIVDALLLAAISTGCLAVCEALSEAHGDARFAMLALGAGISFVAGLLAVMLMVKHVRDAMLPAVKAPCLPASRWASAIASRFALVFGAFVVVALASGAFALIMQLAIVPGFGSEVAKTAIRVFAQIAASAFLPFPVMVLASVAFQVAPGKPLQDVSRLRQAYVPLLVGVMAAGALGHGVLFAVQAVPNEVAATIVRDVALALLGSLWLVSALLVCAKASRADGLPGGRPPAHVRLSPKIAKAGRGVLSCLLAFTLVFSLFGSEPIAFAVEGDRLDPPDPIEQPSAANEVPVDVEPAELEAKGPVEYYEEDVPSGELVSVSGDATTYQTSAKTFETVVGGIDATYTDENGELQLIDNTLERVDQSAGAHYENSANAYTAKLPDAMADGEGLVVEKDGRQVELVPRDGDFTRSAVEGNAIRYTEVREGIDYQYTLVGSLIKEDIVLNKQVEPQEFATLVKVGPDMRVEERDGIAVVRDAGAQESDPSGDILSIAAPVAVDAAGSASDDVSLRVEWAGDGDALVVLSVDWDWLHAKERAYPVRIDPTVNIAPSAVRVGCVEQNWGNRIIGENNYAYAGYDDGVKSETASFNGIGHGMTRAYAAINYDFGNIMSEARINSATFSLHQFTRYSGGATNFGLYRVTGSWDFDNLTWDNQTHLGHELVRFQHASVNAGYVNWDVREVVNNWVQGLYPQRGFCVKAENERGMQCEVFSNRYSAYPPKLSINWEIPDPVGDAYPLSDTTVNVRPVNEVNADGKLKMDGVFADGVATPRSTVDYALNPSDKKGSSYASRSYKYPDSSPWDVTLPQATKYKDKLSNWQSGLFVQLAYDTVYRVRAVPALNGQAGRSVESEGFLVYRATQKDTLPYIAGHYGVSLDTLARDNKVQDTLVVNGNELFVRAPSTSEAYNPGALSEGQKRAIDSALMGRGKHCEYGFEPINLNTGNFVLESVDASIPEIEDDFSLLRTYNAKNEAAQSVFGRNWSFSYAESLSMLEGGTIAYQAGDGKTLYFDPDGAGGYDSPDGFNLKLSKIAYAEGDETRYRYEIEEAEGTLRSFNAWGLLDAVWSPKGLKTSISYDGNFHLESVTSPTGLKYVFTTDDRGRVSSAALPNGSTLRYAYDDAGNLASYADANGKTVRYEYDQDHRMTAWYDQNGTRVVSNEYDAQDRVVVQRDALDRASLLEYSDGTTRAIDAKGNVTVYRYDDQCRTTEIEHADGQIVKRSYDGNNELASDENGTYAYDNRGNLVRETSLDGIVTSYEYDAENRMTKRVEPDGTVVEHEYDATGNLVRSASTSGEDDTYSYDDLGRMVSHENADGDVETFSYSGAWKSTHTDFNGNTETYACNAMGLPVSTTNALGETSRIMYDAAGNRTGEQDASGAYTAYALDAAGFMLRMTDPRGFSTSFTYDGAYNITSMVGADGSVTRYEFDACNNQVRETDPLGAQTTCEYDSRNRLIRSTDAEGGTKTYAYDDRGNVTSVTDALGAETTVSYDRTYDAPTSVTDALGNTTAMAYTARGDMSRVTNPDSSEEVYEYGPGGRLTSETDEAGLVRTYAYTPAGKLVRIDEGGSSYELAYDANGSIVGLRDPLGGKTSVAYDAAGRPVRIDDAEGRTTAYAYDACGRLISEMDAAGNATIWSYDEAGNLTSEVDPNGNKTEFSYDELGRLASKTDALGGVTTYSYDIAGNPVCVTDALGYSRSTEYDKASRVVGMSDALGRTYRYAYDAAGNVVASVLPTGDEESAAYDALGRAVRVVDAQGLATDMTYDSRGNCTGIRDNAGRQDSYAYDAANRLVGATDTTGRTASRSYDARGNLVEEKDFGGATTRYSYDAVGNLVSAVDALGGTTTYAYTASGKVASKTAEATGAAESYAYDEADRLVQAVDALGARTRYAYDAAGNLVSQVDAEGNARAFAYDALNRIVRETDANGGATEYRYDALSNVVGIVRPEGDETAYQYDAAGQLAKHQDALGNVEAFSYDELGNMVEHIDALGAKTSYAYDLHGNVTSKTDALGNVTAYETDLAGNMTALTQANGAVYRYGYDALNRIESVTTPKGYIKTFSYDAQGNLSEESDNLGSRTSYAYDALHSMLSAENARGGQNSFFYDGAGNLVKETDGSGAATTYAYDLAGRLVKTTDALGATSSYAYDAVGNVVASTSPKGSSSSYSYDGNGNMTASQDALGNVTTYSYDGNDRLEKVVDPRGFSTSTSYDAVDRVIGTVDAKGAVTSYEYDAAGNVTSIENAKGFATAYAYDPLGRLEKVTSAEGDVTKYSYDAMGNLTAVEDAMGRATSYGYDQENNLVRIESPSGSIESFEFDIANRLEAVVSPDGSSVRYDYDELNNLVEKSYSIDPGQAVLYSYDALGRCSSRNDAVGDASYERDALGRIVKETDAYGQTLAYAYDEDGNLSSVAYPDGSRVSYGYDAAGNLTSVESAEGRYAYAYDAAGNPVSLTRPDKTATSYEYDASGRIVKLVNADAAGTVISSYAYSYDETGLVRSEDATTTAPDGTTVHAARTFSYTADEKLKSFEEHAGDGAITVSYEHDVVGNRIRQTKTSSEGAETIAYEYDADNRLVKAVSSTEGTTTYAYDANGNMTAKDAEDADAVTYDYGVENRLAAVREGGRLLMAASYDGDGNRVLQVNLYHTREHERANGAEAGPAGTGAGGAGSEEEGVSSSDGDGDGEAGSPSVDLFWYGASLGAACCGSGANPALMAPAVRLVDALWERGWMRMGKLALSGGDPSLVDADALAQLGLSQGDAEAVAASVASIPQERSYLQENYDLTTYVNATVGDLTQVMGETSALSGTTRYTYGLSRLASVDREGESSGYLADGRGSVTAVLDGAGKVSSAYSYGPYGEPEALGAGEGVGELPFFGYNAEEHDPATGQQYLRARYYQVAEGVFGVCDTVLGALVNPLSLNRYLYAEGNPVMKADPTGHRASFASSFGKMVVSAVANLVKQVIRKAIVGIGNAFSASSEPALKSKGNQMLIQQSAADVRNLKIAYYCGSAGYMRFNTGNDTSSLHTALDVGGLIPGCGMIFDAVNGIWYLAEGDTDNAKWSLTAFIPAVGDIASIGKMAGKAGKAADTASGAGKAADTASGAGKAAIVAGKVDDLPEHAREMYEKYDAAGWRGNVSGQAQGTRAGKEYQNNGQDGSVRLPEGEADGEKIIYREFDINDKVPGQSRDGERFLKGTDGSVYYTNDHYHSVIKVK